MKLTEWFPGNVRPARPGVYQAWFVKPDAEPPFYFMWDGRHWGMGARTPDRVVPGKGGSNSPISWRGLAEKP